MQLQDCLHDSFLLMTIPEIIAVFTGILSVWYAKKENILVYPVGIISVLLYVYICLEVKLYADAGINFYYFVVSIYGWYYWKHGGKLQHHELNRKGKEIDSGLLDVEETTTIKEEAEITYNRLSVNLLYLFAAFLFGGIIGFLLDTYTDSIVPYWDGITTALFFVAMILMAQKKIENWIFWIMGDAICIPLFFSKGLCLSSFQYCIFTVLAFAGFISWYRKLQNKLVLK